MNKTNEYGIPRGPQKDGYYYKVVKLDDGKRRTIKAGSKRELARKIKIVLEEKQGNSTEEAQKDTFADLFAEVQERKLALTKDQERMLSVKNSVRRRQQMFDRYFAGTEFAVMPVKGIRARHIERIYEQNLRRYDLRRKATLDMRSILKTTFELALRQGIIKTNPYPICDFEQYRYMVAPDSKVSERGYSMDEMAAIFDLLHKQQGKRSGYFVSYALEFQILCGLRRGEVPPLRWSDIHDGCIDICREQISTGTSNRGQIVNHTKTWTDRKFPVTDKVFDLLKRLKEAQFDAGYNGEYLFPHNGSCISNRAVYQHHKRMCEKLGIEITKDNIRGPHAFRRNAITDFVNKSGGSALVASKLYGNTPSVAEKNYFVGVNMESAAKLLNS